MRYTALLLLMLVLLIPPVFGQYRSSSEVLSGYDPAAREQIFSSGGLLNTTEHSTTLSLLPPSLRGLGIEEPVLNRNLAFLVETLRVIPGMNNPVDRLTVYNALGRVRDLKGRLYHSVTRNKDVPLFEDAVRLESGKKLSPVADPPAAQFMPATETMFLRLKDVNFGSTFYRAGITVNRWGLIYRLVNFKNINYLFIPVIMENNFIAQLYIEPLVDGILVYSIAGADVSDFTASMIDIPSAIQKRLELILSWMVDGTKDPGGS